MYKIKYYQGEIQMRIIIFDDESEFLQELSAILTEYLNKDKSIKYTINITNRIEDIYAIKANKDDLFFLDIATPGNENAGLDAAKYIRKHSREAGIVFVTSHNEKIREALAGLICPLQFLFKPVKSVEKQKLLELMDELTEKITDANALVRIGKNDVRISEIICIHKEKRQTIVSTDSARLYVREGVSSICKKCNESIIMIDKGTAINVDKIAAYNPERRSVYLNNGKELYYSRDRAKVIGKYLDGKEVRS